MTTDWKALAKQRTHEVAELMAEIARKRADLELIRDIASGSTTANSLPHIARIARAALEPTGDDREPQ